VEEIGRIKLRTVSEHITTKGDIHQKLTNPADKGDGIATAITMEDEIR
jgi:hypothetical protein